jgi:hypothetical protein
MKAQRKLFLAALLASVMSVGGPGLAAETKPEGEMRFALYVTVAPAWLDPGEAVLVLQPGFIAGSSFPMALPGALLVPAAPARPGACSFGIRRAGPNQMPEQASHFGHGERQEIGFEIDYAFFPRPQYDGSRRDRRAPASPA